MLLPKPLAMTPYMIHDKYVQNSYSVPHLVIWTSFFSPCSSQEELKECGALLYAGMEAGWLRPVVGSQYPLEKAAQAHHHIIESPGAAGKMVLTM